MIQEQSSLLQDLLSGHITWFEVEIWTNKINFFSTKAIHNFTSHIKHVCLKKKRPQKTATKFREDEASARTDVHISYDTKY